MINILDPHPRMIFRVGNLRKRPIGPQAEIENNEHFGLQKEGRHTDCLPVYVQLFDPHSQVPQTHHQTSHLCTCCEMS